jgi:hypothetical protein
MVFAAMRARRRARRHARTDAAHTAQFQRARDALAGRTAASTHPDQPRAASPSGVETPPPTQRRALGLSDRLLGYEHRRRRRRPPHP